MIDYKCAWKYVNMVKPIEKWKRKVSIETEAECKEWEKEARQQENLQRLRGFRPIDDTFMRALMKDNMPLAEFVLRIIMRKPDLKLIKFNTQDDMKQVTGARSVCLDVTGTDDEGRKYDIEVQRAGSGAEPHRARYHSSVMDVEYLNAGQDFDELPDTYAIFITEEMTIFISRVLPFIQ